MAALLLAGCNALIGISDPRPRADDAAVGQPMVDAPPVLIPDARPALDARPAPDARPILDAPPAPNPDAPWPSITGKIVEQWYSETGVEAHPDQSLAVRALVPAGPGAFTGDIVGTGADGSFIISDPRLPEGTEYDLWTGYGSFVVTTARRDLDLGFMNVGSSSIVLNPPANLLLTMTGMVPIASHTIAALNPALRIFACCTSTPIQGATTLNDFAIAWGYSGLPDGAQLIIAQFTSGELNVPFNNLTYIVKAYTPPDFKMVSGDNAITGAFADPPLRSMALDWRGSQFKALDPPCSGMLTNPPSNEVRVQVAPVGLYGAFVDTFGVDGGPGIVTGSLPDSDANGGSLMFGDPVRLTWPRIRALTRFATCRYDLGDGSAIHTANIFNRALVDLGVSPGPMAPIVGPPTAIKLNGADATRSVTNVGLKPILSWTPPALGTVNRYRVQVLRVKAGEYDQWMATFMLKASPSPSLQIPDGVLDTHYRYVFSVAAISTSGDPEVAPYQWTLPFGSANALTGLISPGP